MAVVRQVFDGEMLKRHVPRAFQEGVDAEYRRRKHNRHDDQSDSRPKLVLLRRFDEHRAASASLDLSWRGLLARRRERQRDPQDQIQEQIQTTQCEEGEYPKDSHQPGIHAEMLRQPAANPGDFLVRAGAHQALCLRPLRHAACRWRCCRNSWRRRRRASRIRLALQAF